MISLYPDGYFAVKALKNILTYYGNINETDEGMIRDYIDLIKEMYPGTKISKAAEKILISFDNGSSSYHRVLKLKEKALRRAKDTSKAP